MPLRPTRITARGAPKSALDATNAATTGTKATSDLALYTTVISGTNSTMSFYLNGKQVGDVTYTIPAGGLTNYGDLVAYIGKSSYADPNSKLDVDDYAVYDTAISAADVTKLYDAQVLDKAEAAVKAAVPASATEDFALPTSAAGVSIAWKSDNAAIAVDNATGKATVTRPAATAADAEVMPHRHVWQQRQNRRLHGPRAEAALRCRASQGRP
ncbi:MAG: LamG-like jellyroll fold domain-containing protein [Bifidobacterium bifidum]